MQMITRSRAIDLDACLSGKGVTFKITINIPINLGHCKLLVKERIMFNFKLLMVSTQFLELDAKCGVYLFE